MSLWSYPSYTCACTEMGNNKDSHLDEMPRAEIRTWIKFQVPLPHCLSSFWWWSPSSISFFPFFLRESTHNIKFIILAILSIQSSGVKAYSQYVHLSPLSKFPELFHHTIEKLASWNNHFPLSSPSSCQATGDLPSIFCVYEFAFSWCLVWVELYNVCLFVSVLFH